MNKKVPIFLVLILAVALLVGVFGFNSLPLITSANAYEQNVVIIDAGHGGFDGGAVAFDGTVEKDINLKISLTLAQFLRQSGFKTVLTRETDTSTEDINESISSKKKSDLSNRVALMSNYENSVFISIHLNKFTTSSASGAQVFYSKNLKDSRLLGECIQSSIVSLLQNENKRVIKKGNGSTYILERATVPTVIVECGFLSNVNDLNLLKTEEYQQKMAFSIYCGILNFYQNR